MLGSGYIIVLVRVVLPLPAPLESVPPAQPAISLPHHVALTPHVIDVLSLLGTHALLLKLLVERPLLL